MTRALRWSAAVVVASLATVACGRQSSVRYNSGGDVSNAPPPPLPPMSELATLPEGPYPGIAVSAVEATARNPYGTDTAVVERGRELFVGLNCTGCHGYEAKAGLMAPNLTDNYWRYGGSEADVFNSIYEGRARGMPAWGAVLSENQIWALVSYIASLGAMTGPRLPTTIADVPARAQTAMPHNKRQP
jgi:mono/diheme cytochrome c family protein